MDFHSLCCQVKIRLKQGLRSLFEDLFRLLWCNYWLRLPLGGLLGGPLHNKLWLLRSWCLLYNWLRWCRLLLSLLLLRRRCLIAPCMLKSPLIKSALTEKLGLHCFGVGLLVSLECLEDLEGVTEIYSCDLIVLFIREPRDSALLLSTPQQALEVSHLKDQHAVPLLLLNLAASLKHQRS